MGKGRRKGRKRVTQHCFRCGSTMKPRSIKLGDVSVRSWRCPKDGEEILHPKDAQKALFLNKLKKRGVKVKIGILNKAPYLRFPKAFLDILKKGDEVIIKVVEGKKIQLEIQ
jgi:hypothetical protein